MTHQIAKLMLDHADTVIDRENAIRSAIQLGMPLQEIEEYMDWIETLRGRNAVPQGNENQIVKVNPRGCVSKD